ncbi:MAG TPA: type III-B CRISPR-associated protein Cas10/Cmr2, partial [Thermoprotei archaeon]|nr:type III-B CRISPR-associated protein Cas10/Cmr2 [Thermoprotei archaeon]
IHKYISNSRKLRDLWVSSYIASGLIWMALSPLIFILGPDIVLTPSLRMNPVYGYTLNTWLNKLFRNIGLDADLRNWMENYLMIGPKSDRIYRLGLKYIQDLKNPPDYSIQPGIFTLALPPRKIVEDVINLFRELHNKYRDKFFLTGYPFEILNDERISRHLDREYDDKLWIHDLIMLLIKIAWEKLYQEYTSENSLREFLMRVSEEFDLSNFDSIYRDIYPYINIYRENPPFIVRIYVAKVDDAFKHIECIEDNIAKNANLSGEFRKGFLTPLLMEALNELLNMFQEDYYSLRETPYEGIELTKYTDAIYRYIRGGGSPTRYLGFKIEDGSNITLYPTPKDPGFNYCTSCGELPALLIMRYDIDNPYLSYGEKLCPVCLMKRIASTEPSWLIRHIYGVDEDINIKSITIKFKSTYEVSNNVLVKLLPKIKNLLKDNNELTSKLRNKFKDREDLEDFIESLIERDDSINRDMFTSEDPDLRDKLNLFIKALFSDVDGIYRLDSESVSEPCIMIYYGLYLTDGDHMGKLISGELYRSKTIPKKYIVCRERNILNPEDEINFYINYLLSSLNITDENVLNLFNSILEGWRDTILNEFFKDPCHASDRSIDLRKYDEYATNISTSLWDEYRDFDRNVINGLTILLGLYFFRIRFHDKTFIYKPRYIPSMTFYKSISRALINSIINDVKKIEGIDGIVIYAGGDDLMAILPLLNVEVKDRTINVKENIIDALTKIRSFYSFGNGIGFDSICKTYHIPMLVGHGRSSSLMIAHYRSPLKNVIEYLEYSLDEFAKDGSKWMYIKKSRRDMLFLQERDGFVIGVIHYGRPEIVKIPSQVYIEECKFKPYSTLKSIEELIGKIRWVGYIKCKLSKSFLRDIDKDPILNNMSLGGSMNIGDAIDTIYSIDKYLVNAWRNIYIGNNVLGCDKEAEAKEQFIDEILSEINSLNYIVDYKAMSDGGNTVINVYLPILIPRFIRYLSSGWRCGE